MTAFSTQFFDDFFVRIIIKQIKSPKEPLHGIQMGHVYQITAKRTARSFPKFAASLLLPVDCGGRFPHLGGKHVILTVKLQGRVPPQNGARRI